MKLSQLTILGSLIGGTFFVLAVPSHAAFHGRGFNHAALANDMRKDRNEIHQDRRELRDNRMELNQDRRKLDQDLHNSASHTEITNDLGEIRQDRREIAKDRQDFRSERRDLKQDLDQEHHSLFERWRSWWGGR